VAFLLKRIRVEKRKRSIAVVDGQGGGIGSAMIKRLRETFAEEVEVIALGTNAMATGAMLKQEPTKVLQARMQLFKRSRRLMSSSGQRLSFWPIQ